LGPEAEFLRIIQQPIWNLIIRHADDLPALAVSERLAIFGQEVGAVAIARLQIEPILKNQSDHDFAGINALAAEHAADVDRTKMLEEIVEAACIALQCSAGVIETLSPQPQAEV
jgi:hypothetical protein